MVINEFHNPEEIEIGKWYVRWETNGGNGDRKCSGTVVMSICGGTKSAYRHASTPTLKSILKPRKSVKNESYLGVKLTRPCIGVWE